jgi:hypothetical protein
MSGADRVAARTRFTGKTHLRRRYDARLGVGSTSTGPGGLIDKMIKACARTQTGVL